VVELIRSPAVPAVGYGGEARPAQRVKRVKSLAGPAELWLFFTENTPHWARGTSLGMTKDS
jgi:hypothetical protein